MHLYVFCRGLYSHGGRSEWETHQLDSVYIAEDKYPLCSHNISVTLVKNELVRIFIQNTFFFL